MKHHRRPAGRIGRCSDRRRPYLQRRSGAGRMWASVTLLKQRRAFMTEIMSTTTVLVKSIKSTCRVKFPTEKDHPRGAISILLVSRGSRGSRVSGPLGVWIFVGVWTSGCLDLLGVWTSYLRVLSIHSCNRCRVHIVQHKGRSCLERRPLVARVGSTPHSPSLGVIPCPSIQLTGDGKTAAHLDASGFLSGLLIQLSDTLKNHPRSCGGLPVLGRRGSGV